MALISDLPYDNETYERDQKDCSWYLFVCNSQHPLEELEWGTCPYEVRLIKYIVQNSCMCSYCV